MSCRAKFAGRLVPQISSRVQIVVGNQKWRPLGALVASEERTPSPRSATVVLAQVRRDQARDGNPVDRARHHFRSWPHGRHAARRATGPLTEVNPPPKATPLAGKRRRAGSHSRGMPARVPAGMFWHVFRALENLTPMGADTSYADLVGLSVVLPVRIELTTSPLPRGCSTTELRQPRPRPRRAPKAGRREPRARGNCHRGWDGARIAAFR